MQSTHTYSDTVIYTIDIMEIIFIKKLCNEYFVIAIPFRTAKNLTHKYTHIETRARTKLEMNIQRFGKKIFEYSKLLVLADFFFALMIKFHPYSPAKFFKSIRRVYGSCFGQSN